MVRSLISRLLARRSDRVTPAGASRFVPAVEAFEAREVPAVLGLFAPAEEAPAAPADSGSDTAALTITLSDTLVSSYSVAAADGGADASGKVVVQDIHFIQKVDKASPQL